MTRAVFGDACSISFRAKATAEFRVIPNGLDSGRMTYDFNHIARADWTRSCPLPSYARKCKVWRVNLCVAGALPLFAVK